MSVIASTSDSFFCRYRLTCSHRQEGIEFFGGVIEKYFIDSTKAFWTRVISFYLNIYVAGSIVRQMSLPLKNTSRR